MRCIWWIVINVCWNDVGVLDWLDNSRWVSPWISSVRYGMKYFEHQIPESESGNTVRNDLSSCRTVKLKSVSCTSNLLAQTCDFRKCKEFLLMLILSLQGLQQNQSLETILVCIVVLCFPHNNIASIHLYDECKRSNAPSVCLKMFSFFVKARASLFTDHKISDLPIRTQNRHFQNNL